ncbi:MAG TPA: YhjD/YihY/BrkB family envelope integrity protein [Acidimicrobiales bacterium]|nr:YhjD/YihY/BrkB family envelope integrity protein [Acidimicrobiales bacterium]
MSARSERGRHATTPTDVPAQGWRDVAGRVKGEVRDDAVTLLGAGVAFYAFLALVPALIAVVSIYGLVASPQDVTALIDDALTAAPEEVSDLVDEQLTRITETSPDGLGIAAAVSILVALWSASSGMAALVQAVNIAYDERNDRGFLARRGLALLLTVGAVAFFLVTVGLIVVVPAVVAAADLGAAVGWVVNLARWPVLLAAFVGALAVLYRVGPHRDDPEWRWTSPGAVIAAALWLIASIGFSLYASSFGSYNETYGALAGIVVALLWLWITAVVVILGAEINAELEHQTDADTTVGPDEPLGERDAAKADAVAAPATDPDPTTPTPTPRPPGGPMSQHQPPSSSGATTDTIKREGESAVGETQRQAQDVARHAGERAGDVVDTARHEVRDVIDEARHAIEEEADGRTRQAGGALRELSRDLHRMSEQSEERSTAAEYVDAVAGTVGRLADRLEHDGSSGLVDDLRHTAEQRPGTFATGSALAGFALGRLIRNGQQPRDVGDGDGREPRRSEGDDRSGGEIDLRGTPAPAHSRVPPPPPPPSPIAEGRP